MRGFLLIASALLAACGPAPIGGGGGGGGGGGFDGIALVSVSPMMVVPGTRLELRGAFVTAGEGETNLRLRGDMDGSPVDARIPARFVDFDRMELVWEGGFLAGLGADDGVFSGEAFLEVDSNYGDEIFESDAMPVTLEVRSSLEPRMDTLMTGVIFVNDPIVVEGDGFLLGGEEGDTVAVVDGCFREDGFATCVPVSPREVPLRPDNPFDRTRATFPFDPRVAGIRPGTFEGTVYLKNLHGPLAGSVELSGAHESADYQIVPSKIFRFSPSSASLGQYVRIEGGGFVGTSPGSPDQTFLLTTIEFEGTFMPDGATESSEVNVTLVPEFVAGPLVRYVLNEEDDVGQRIDLRRQRGEFYGRARPVVQMGADTVTGDWTNVNLSIRGVKQIVFVNFLPSYVESLRHFGLRAVDDRIRSRVLEVARRDYAGLNVEFRTEPPDDFALFAQVDISGPDPNGLGLLGYDNSPGKDVENERLYDKIGGVNATTQEDGYPGYGGVFVESFFGFSNHPGSFAMKLDGSDELFDETFDPFRPDRDGNPVVARDLGEVPADVYSGDGCPAAGNRAEQITCAIWVLGSMIGTTMTHEVGHSFGLANPYGEGFHNPGDQPNRLMDAGGARTFPERAELFGEGPAVFCEDEFEYLREILPSLDGDPGYERPSCY